MSEEDDTAQAEGDDTKRRELTHEEREALRRVDELTFQPYDLAKGDPTRTNALQALMLASSRVAAYVDPVDIAEEAA